MLLVVCEVDKAGAVTELRDLKVMTSAVMGLVGYGSAVFVFVINSLCIVVS